MNSNPEAIASAAQKISRLWRAAEWDMIYLTEGERRFSRGTDQFIFQEGPEGHWLAIWRYVDFWEDRKDG